MPGSSAFSTSALLVPARVCPLPLHLLCLCLPEFIRFLCVCSTCACWSLSASSASAPPVPRVCPLPLRLLYLCLPEFVRFFYVCSAYACRSLLASFASAPPVPGVCPLPLHLLCLCLCLVCLLLVPSFFPYCVSAVDLFFKIL